MFAIKDNHIASIPPHPLAALFAAGRWEKKSVFVIAVALNVSQINNPGASFLLLFKFKAFAFVYKKLA